MAESKTKTRNWLVDFTPDESRMRCQYKRQGKRLLQFTVQLEMKIDEEWRPVVRYDNAHGFCHRDTIHPDGSQDKTPVYYGDVNETFTKAIEDVRDNWKSHAARYLGEMNDDRSK